MRWLQRWWPTIVWAAIISGFSTRAFTADHTRQIFFPFLHWLLPNASIATLELIHHIIRKSGHVTEYFIFSLLILHGIRAGRAGTRLTWVLATIAAVACYASLDEFHQSFVPGRGAAVSDVLLDTAAGISAQIAAAVVMVRNQKKEKRDQQLVEKAV